MLKSDPRARVGMAELEELEDRIEKLRHAYEVYFAGLDQIDPSDKKIAIRRIMTRLNEMRLRNPRLRFKLQSLIGRFVSLNQYWTRTMREIESGTFQRCLIKTSNIDKGKAQAYFGKEAPKFSESETDRIQNAARAASAMAAPATKERQKRNDVRLTNLENLEEKDIKNLRFKRPLGGPDTGLLPVGRPSAPTPVSESLPPAPPDMPPPVPSEAAIPPPSPFRTPESGLRSRAVAPSSPAPALGGNGGKSGGMDRITRTYMEARKRLDPNGKGVKREAIEAHIAKTRETLRKKYKTDQIDFKVVEKAGKVVLKPVIKRKTT